MSKNDPLKYVLFIFLSIGILFSALAWYFYKKQANFTETAIKTTGKVVDLRVSRKGSKAPIVEYFDKNQRQHFYYHNVFTRPSSYSVGDEVELFYSPTNAEDARLSQDYVLILIFGILGVVFITVSAICIKVFGWPSNGGLQND